MEIDISTVEKVSNESADAIETILRRLFPNEEEYYMGRGISYESKHRQIPYHNRTVCLKNGIAVARYSAFSQNGFFNVSLTIENLPGEIYRKLLQETKKSSPEIHAALEKCRP